MQRIDGPTRSAARPAPRATGTGTSAPGYFTAGNPIAGTPPTTLDVDWANGIQEEVAGVIEHAGITLDKANTGQLLAALQALFVSAGGDGGVSDVDDEITAPLPGGLLLKMGLTPIGSGSNAVNGRVTFHTPFPTNLFHLSGNADGRANAGWTPIVVMLLPGDRTGAPYIADSANAGQSIDPGKNIRWIAVGN